MGTDTQMTLAERQPTGMEVLAEILRRTDDPVVAIEVAKQAAALQQSAERFQWEREERQGKIDFDDALMRCQKAIARVRPDRQNQQTSSWYASYAKLDRIVRPIYTDEDFSIAFSERDCPTPGKIRVVALVSRSGITRDYIKDITPPLLGPKGNAVMTPTHGDGAALSYAKRYLVLDIFNIAVGIDAEDTDGNSPAEITQEMEARLQEWKDALRQCDEMPQLKSTFADAYKFSKTLGEGPKREIQAVYEEKKRILL